VKGLLIIGRAYDADTMNRIKKARIESLSRFIVVSHIKGNRFYMITI